MTITTRPQLATGGPWGWRSIDIVTVAILGVALGVAFWGWDAVYGILSPVFAVYPPSSSLALGVWLLPAVVGGLVIRRPGAALFCEFIAATVEALLGNQWGFNVLVSGFLQGLGVEIAMAVLVWRNWTVVVAVLGGLLAAFLELTVWEWWVYQPNHSWPQRLAALGFALLSGALIAGIGGWLLVRALARTGALEAFPPGRERLAGQA
ncbi:ABC transporter permease [Arachnia propionica]|uniref:ABC transporter permease n=1 Tax=Arachnia propionica TaxID=1750 RepID=A0A3P1TAA8_9ACTN|nr:ECF transporter S component [Arachnia propionica]RRD06238.1 ABC transporter permease [Arachnia propionica]